MNRLRNRLLFVFLAATIAPLAATLWITTSLLDRSLSLITTNEVDKLSQSLEIAGRALYSSTRDLLKFEAAHTTPKIFSGQPSSWPDDIREFYESRQTEHFELSGDRQERAVLFVRKGKSVHVFERQVAGPGMKPIADQYAEGRAVVTRARARDLRRGFFWTLVIAAACIWTVCLLVLTIVTSRITKPMEQLTAGLAELASGNLGARLSANGHDEVGQAMRAFNETAGQLQRSQDRLVHLTRLSSWQTLARKMAHEVKNSLTPIRLTMEEIMARRGDRDDRFIDTASQIVVDEVITLEKRVRAFSHFAAEPPVQIESVDVNGLLEERVAFLKNAHPEVTYDVALDSESGAMADQDLLKGVLTNLLENAAEAAGAGGMVRSKTLSVNGHVSLEVHDSGPGLSVSALATLFEPTISFKKSGMGLGLSIARRSALLSGGDIQLIEGELGGAAFRVTLPRANAS